ncbi:MAG: hypothetical protein GXP54_13345 [Deltaproteobacteria bacterium]|nr:hypothetical protein [Deltaproteobacteria bacterium]
MSLSRLLFTSLAASSLAASGLTVVSCGSDTGVPSIDVIVMPDGGSDPGGGLDSLGPGDHGQGDAKDPGKDPGKGCQTGKPCDDDRACTSDICDEDGNCRYELKEGFCLVSGVCRQSGEADENDACHVCDPKVSAVSWSPADNGSPCDASGQLDQCEVLETGSTCVDGACVPGDIAPRDCDDGNPCTKDGCEPESGCLNVPVSGGSCILDNACEEGTCNQGKCVIPAGAGCDDGNPCTKDECDSSSGCSHTPLDGVPCDDGDACTFETTCDQGACVGVEVNCNDGNVCTMDGCDAVTGCFHDPADNECCTAGLSICDDGNPCTDDGCNPSTLECEYQFNDALCSDQDPCTVQDTCADGACMGIPMDCNDNNPCTLDSCEGGQCVNQAQDGIDCDDGLDCSTGDHCVQGECVADTSNCVCVPVFYPSVSKMTSMSIAGSGNPGEGLDLDGDPGTCAPSSDCSEGIDNSLGPLASLGNDAIVDSMTKGSIMILLEHRKLKTDGTPYQIAVYVGKGLDSSNPDCDYQNETCAYLIDAQSLDPDCQPVVSLDNATIVNDVLTAGGKGYTFPFDLPILGDVSLHVDLYYATIKADVTMEGGKVATMTGILAGAVPKEQLKTAIEALPDDTQLPMPKDQIIQLLDLLVQPDIDGDEDGVKESASIGIQFTAIAGTISGVE